jgi:hypothetical protein
VCDGSYYIDQWRAANDAPLDFGEIPIGEARLQLIPDQREVTIELFARRDLVRGLSLDLQVASDNARGWVFPSGRRYWAFFREPSDWYWMFKLTANI